MTKNVHMKIIDDQKEESSMLDLLQIDVVCRKVLVVLCEDFKTNGEILAVAACLLRYISYCLIENTKNVDETRKILGYLTRYLGRVMEDVIKTAEDKIKKQEKVDVDKD